MRFISTRVHGFLDYLVGIILIASPWIFNFATGKTEMWVPGILGAAAIVYSLITDYELGALKILSMKSHLNLDLTSGILLAVSPWLFGFSNRVAVPHVIFGFIEIAVVLMTRTTPYVNNSNTSTKKAF